MDEAKSPSCGLTQSSRQERGAATGGGLMTLNGFSYTFSSRPLHGEPLHVSCARTSNRWHADPVCR
ncbi:hypothetical protein EMIT0P253_20204 [Pseudomonas sp. IT-P253]